MNPTSSSFSPFREKMQSAFSIHLDRLAKWLPTRRDIRVLEVSYNELLSDPANEVNRVATFLDGAPSTTLMLEAIDPSLYRNRRASVES